jgi:hypothetical protein
VIGMEVIRMWKKRRMKREEGIGTGKSYAEGN